MKVVARCCWGVLFLAVASAARADGAMVYRGRELLRQGPAERSYCEASGSGTERECDRVLTKVLSGYSYGRGHLAGGLALEPAEGFESPRGLGALHLSLISAALPGGAIELATFDGVLGDAHTRRVRATLMDAKDLFFCRDAQTDVLVAPVIGMLTSACRRDALFAVDLGLVAMQWDLATHRMLGEWVRLGPALELLSNGFSYAHLLRSIVIGVPFDVRSTHGSEQRTDTQTSLGAGVRVSALYRTPHWEARLAARHRLALTGGVGLARDHSVDSELLLLHNFLRTDAVVMQLGVSLRASWSQEPQRAFVAWASSDRHTSAFAGLHLGWAHEPPGI